MTLQIVLYFYNFEIQTNILCKIESILKKAKFIRTYTKHEIKKKISVESRMIKYSVPKKKHIDQCRHAGSDSSIQLKFR